MAYITIFIFSLLWLSIYAHGDLYVKFFSGTMFFLTLFFVPSFQYNIGTDYFTYYSIVDDVYYIDYLMSKGEILFYFIYHVIRFLGLPNQSIFFISATIQLLLLVNVIRLLDKQKTYCVIWFFVGYFLITNYYHNQMNQLRSYVSLMFFANALLYKFNRRFVISAFFAMLAAFSHATAIALIPFLFINDRIVNFVVKNRIPVVVLTFFLYSLNIYTPTLNLLVKFIFPFYSDYVSTLFNEKASFFETATKVYYLPIVIYVVYYIGKHKDELSKFDKYMFSFFALTCNSYLLLMQTTVFFRFWIFFIIFYPLVLSRVLSFKNKFGILDFCVVAYLFVPYFIKVVVAPVREFCFDLTFFHG
jgi:hypothetical protein